MLWWITHTSTTVITTTNEIPKRSSSYSIFPSSNRKSPNFLPWRKRQGMATLFMSLLTWMTVTSIMICGAESQHHEENDATVVVDTTGEIISLSDESSSNDSKIPETTTTHHSTTNNFTSADLECRIWLAPSTLQGAGLGMFAGTDFQPNEELLHGGDITIAITDINQHNVAPGQTEYGTFLWDEYTWSAPALKMGSIGYQQNIASEGFGSAANSFLPVYNVDEWAPRITYTNALHRSRDPGAGAFTQYHHRLSTSRRFIEAGEELYVSCTYLSHCSFSLFMSHNLSSDRGVFSCLLYTIADGDTWFESRPQLGPIPLYEDLNIASSVLEKYTLLQERLQAKFVDLGTMVATDIWTTFVQKSVYNDSRVLMGAFHHNDPNELSILQTKFKNNITAARIDESKRDLEWLRTHGTCGDHIIAQPSTIKQAAMGGFATRFLPNETIVAQLPMIHVTNRSRFNIYGLSKDTDGDYVPYNSTVIGQQLLLNYCYGHAESSLLLCPYGPMNSYVNHNQTLANVRLRWGRSESGNHMPSLLQSSIETFESDATAKLAMELIAIRDIEEGEEIFLNYGDEWEAAWQKHVATWQPVPDAESYTSAAQLEADNVTRLRTVFEEIERPMYPDTLITKCDTTITSFPDETIDHFYNGTLERFVWKNDQEWWPCTILRYKLDETTGDYLYAVRLYIYGDDGETVTSSTLVENVPRLAIHFVDQPMTCDQLLPNAFRHDIRIPDAIFPVAWRNVLRRY